MARIETNYNLLIWYADPENDVNMTEEEKVSLATEYADMLAESYNTLIPIMRWEGSPIDMIPDTSTYFLLTLTRDESNTVITMTFMNYNDVVYTVVAED